MTKIIKNYPLQVDNNGNLIVTSNLILTGGLVMPPAINITISSDTNNLVIPNLSTGVLVRMNVTGNYSLTGIVPASITEGGLMFFSNIGTGVLALKDNDANSAANNRFIMGSNKTIQPGESGIFVYDTISLRFRLFSINI